MSQKQTTDQETKEQYYKLTLNRAIAHYGLGDLTAKGLLSFYLRVKLKSGWKGTITQAETCKDLGISKSAFYSALSRLKSEGSINWWVDPTTKIYVTYTDIDEQSTIQDSSPRSRKAVHDRGLDSKIVESEGLEPLPGNGSGVSPDLSSDLSSNSLSFKEGGEFPQKSAAETDPVEHEENQTEPTQPINENVEVSQETDDSSTGTQSRAIILNPVKEQSASFKSSVAVLTRSTTLESHYAQVEPDRHPFLTFDADNTPWLNPPRHKHDVNFKPEFVTWHGELYMRNWQKADIHQAKADFRKAMLNAPDKILIAWDQYCDHLMNAVDTAKIHLEVSGKVDPVLQQKLEKHLPVVCGGSQNAIAISGGGIQEEPSQLSPSGSELKSLAPEIGSAASGAYVPYQPIPDDELPMDEESVAQRAAIMAEVREKLFKVGKWGMPKPAPETRQHATPRSVAEAREMIQDPILRAEVIAWCDRNGYEVDQESLEIFKLEF